MNVGATNKEYRDNAMCCLDIVFIKVQSLRCFVPELPTDTLLEYILPKLKPFVNLRKLILEVPKHNQVNRLNRDLDQIIDHLFEKFHSLSYIKLVYSREPERWLLFLAD